MGAEPRGITDMVGGTAEISDPGTPFFPLSGITESPARLTTLWVCAAEAKDQHGGEGEDGAEGSLQDSGEWCHCSACCLCYASQNMPPPVHSFGGKQLWQLRQDPSTFSLNSPVSLAYAPFWADKTRLLNSKPTFPICMLGNYVI